LRKRNTNPTRLEAFTEQLKELYADEGGNDLAGLVILHHCQKAHMTMADF
jgi:hypothetical protein